MERPSIFTAFEDQACIGHLLNRGRCGWEGFDTDDRSCGTFVTLGEAAAAVLAKVFAKKLDGPAGEGDHG